jgi:hypothetical protein
MRKHFDRGVVYSGVRGSFEPQCTPSRLLTWDAATELIRTRRSDAPPPKQYPNV